MWEDTKDGFTAKMITTKKEEVTVKIIRQRQICVVDRDGGLQQIICGVRDNKVKIWNDQVFDANINNQIKAKMEATVLKKVVANPKRK